MLNSRKSILKVQRKTPSNEPLITTELHPERWLLVLGLCPTHNNQHIRQNQMRRKIPDHRDPKQRKSLTRSRLSEHSQAMEKGHRQTRLPGGDRQLPLHTQPTRNRAALPDFTKAYKDFKDTPDPHKLPYLLGEIQQCVIAAARFICCDERRT